MEASIKRLFNDLGLLKLVGEIAPALSLILGYIVLTKGVANVVEVALPLQAVSVSLNWILNAYALFMFWLVGHVLIIIGRWLRYGKPEQPANWDESDWETTLEKFGTQSSRSRRLRAGHFQVLAEASIGIGVACAVLLPVAVHAIFFGWACSVALHETVIWTVVLIVGVVILHPVHTHYRNKWHTAVLRHNTTA